MNEQSCITDQVVDALALTHDEAQMHDEELRAAGARLLFGAWYSNPDKAQIDDDITRYTERRNVTLSGTCFIGRAVIRGSNMVGVGLWLTAPDEE